MITLIAVVGPGNCLGAEGNLLYSLRDDMRHFKAVTTGHPVVMGRKTFESFPGGPLPGRTNIVISRRRDYAVPSGVILCDSVEAAIDAARHAPGGDNVMVIGGGEIYRQAIDLATDLELTEVVAEPSVEPDTFFPTIDPARWQVTHQGEITDDSRSAIPYRFIHYTRR